MKQLISAVVAALFAAVTFTAAAQPAPSGSTSADAPKSEKPAKKTKKTKKPKKSKPADSASTPAK